MSETLQKNPFTTPDDQRDAMFGPDGDLAKPLPDHTFDVYPPASPNFVAGDQSGISSSHV